MQNKFIFLFLFILSSSVLAESGKNLSNAQPQAKFVANALGEEEIAALALMHTQEYLKGLSKNYDNLPDAKSQDAMRNVHMLTSNDEQLNKEVLELSASLLPWLLEALKKDPNLVKDVLNSSGGQMDRVAKVYEKMPAAEREKIKQLSLKIEQKKKQKP